MERAPSTSFPFLPQSQSLSRLGECSCPPYPSQERSSPQDQAFPIQLLVGRSFLFFWGVPLILHYTRRYSMTRSTCTCPPSSFSCILSQFIVPLAVITLVSSLQHGPFFPLKGSSRSGPPHEVRSHAAILSPSRSITTQKQCGGFSDPRPCVLFFFFYPQTFPLRRPLQGLFLPLSLEFSLLPCQNGLRFLRTVCPPFFFAGHFPPGLRLSPVHYCPTRKPR